VLEDYDLERYLRGFFVETNGSEPISTPERMDFIRQIVAEDMKTGKWDGRVNTRFPPEPNGYLHIGHAKSICLNYGIAADFGGKFNLRFDDTNPCKEEQEYVDSIIADVKWLGADWQDRLFYGSDYFQQMYDWAVDLIKKGLAYVCDLTAEETRQHRGTLTEPGKNSPWRDRSVEENLDLFERMKNGEFPDGSKTLKAKIDMAHPNINLRDPVMYRILHAHHHRQGDEWCVYPMYDWAHGIEDSVEGITHSICTLEFENHRPLYDWFLDQLGAYHPQQIEFARLNLTYTVMSKRKLLQLVKEKHVSGWDDPRMPTICGLRRRGFSPEAIRQFCRVIGVNKFNSTVDYALLEHCLRDHLNATSARVMAVLNPLKVVITNYPDGQTEEMDAVNNPEDPSAGSRKVPFSKVLYIERDDFMEEPPKKFFRLSPGREVRLRYAYFITCTDVIKDASGKSSNSAAPTTRPPAAVTPPTDESPRPPCTGSAPPMPSMPRSGSMTSCSPRKTPTTSKRARLSSITSTPIRCRCLPAAKSSRHSKTASPLDRWQFERLGYFCTDDDSTPEKPVFNKTVGLKDTWAKIQKKEA
jgi:glutaminyl-tRNA synthetase